MSALAKKDEDIFESMSDNESKICPFCESEISLTTKKCKNCAEFLDSKSRRKLSLNSGIAAARSFLIPVLGQIYKGKILSGNSGAQDELIRGKQSRRNSYATNYSINHYDFRFNNHLSFSSEEGLGATWFT